MAGRETVRTAGQEQGGDILSGPMPTALPLYDASVGKVSSRFWPCRAAERRGHERHEIGHFQDPETTLLPVLASVFKAAILIAPENRMTMWARCSIERLMFLLGTPDLSMLMLPLD